MIPKTLNPFKKAETQETPNNESETNEKLNVIDADKDYFIINYNSIEQTSSSTVKTVDKEKGSTAGMDEQTQVNSDATKKSEATSDPNSSKPPSEKDHKEEVADVSNLNMIKVKHEDIRKLLSQLPVSKLVAELRLMAPKRSVLGSTLGIIVNLLFIIVIGSWLYDYFYGKKSSGGGSPFSLMGVSNHEFEIIKDSDVRFSDVKGIDEILEDLQEIKQFLELKKEFSERGCKLPKGLLLHGAPGTGKTLIAKALAGETNYSFIVCSGSTFDEMYVGLGAKRVRELFKLARENKPCIVFIDEIDALGGRRQSKDSNYHRQTLNEMLNQMDGFTKNDEVLVVGATNLLSALDSALLRPGRFDRQLKVNLPDLNGRKDLFTYYLGKGKFSADVHERVEMIARETTGMSGADIANIVNEALLHSVFTKKDEADYYDIEFALEKQFMGRERKNASRTKKELEMTAYHEAGHALICYLIDGGSDLKKLTIVERGNSLGATHFIPKSETEKSMNYGRYLGRIGMALGGRAAEELIYGKNNITSGCSSDLTTASSLARSMIRELGFSEGGLLTKDGKNLSVDYYNRVDKEANDILNKSYKKVLSCLSENKDILVKIVEKLLEKETLEVSEIKTIIDSVGVKTGFETQIFN